jgi:hypothetical protein
MLLGGALFGLVDHAWNGELMMISQAWLSDIALGFAITGTITAGWGLIAYKNHVIVPLRMIGRRTGFLSR